MLAVRRISNILYMRFSTSTYSMMSKYEAINEPILTYLKGSNERQLLEETIKKYQNTITDVPIVIGSEEIRTDDVHYQVMPFDHSQKIAKFYYASKELLEKAIKVCLEARESWEMKPLEERVEIFRRAADLASKKYRIDLDATTMLGQGKNIFQCEIDAGTEFPDFLRFNCKYALDLQNYQPNSTKESTNKLYFRGLEGFVAAISPFNFTAIGGNLSSAPALMGNVVLWKPSDTALLSNYIIFKIFQEAGVPPGVINFMPADGPVFGDTITSSPQMAAINFTGSLATFRHLWQCVSRNVLFYKHFPRLVGECGGKNYHFIHKSADPDTVVACTIRSAFEYSGQKCSACSRMYVSESLWPKVKEGLLENHKNIKLGPPNEYDTFMSAVIDYRSFNRIKGYLDYAKQNPNLTVLAGGNYDDSKGYFIEPTIIQSGDPQDKIMSEEIFGPVLSVYVYPDNNYKDMMRMLGNTSPYALTGAIFGQDKEFITEATQTLRNTAGNFYINDKSTGAVVGQQPFGGARGSGTNDKAGGPHYLLRWTSPQAIKETHVPQHDWKYSYMEV